MYCSNCNMQINDNATTCPYCGETTNVKSLRNRDYSDSYYGEYDNSGGMLAYGIISLALAAFVYLGILSVIFGAIAVKRSNNYDGVHVGREKAARITGMFGLVLGVIEVLLVVVLMIACWSFM